MGNKPIFIRNTVIAAHLLLTGYGHWLPNDPRGSGSLEIRKLGLEQMGSIHFGRKRIQPPRSELRAFYRQAEALLAYPVIWFDAPMRAILANAIGQVVGERGYTMYACAILRNHTHFVIRTHREDAITMLSALAEGMFDAIHASGLVPAHHPVWADRPYKIFLRTPRQVHGRIRYVEENPMKEGLARQNYAFVSDFSL